MCSNVSTRIMYTRRVPLKFNVIRGVNFREKKNESEENYYSQSLQYKYISVHTFLAFVKHKGKYSRNLWPNGKDTRRPIMEKILEDQ